MIAETFIKRPVTAIVISVLIVIVGIISLQILPIAQFPDITPPNVSVVATYVGADAETMEQTTATSIETQVNGSPGMSFMTSSSSNGSARLNVTFDVGTNIDIAALDVQNRASIALPSLPDEVKRMGLLVRKSNPGIMMVLTLYSPDNSHDTKYLGNYANIYVRDALLRVPGVGDIMSTSDNFSMRVWMDPDKLANLSLTPQDISNALSEQNLQIALGTIGGTPQPESQVFEYNVTTKSRLTTVSEFENVIIRVDPKDHSVVYLKDVATVELGKYSYASNDFVDGFPAAFMMIFQAPGGNAVDTYAGVLETLEKMKKSFPKGMDYKIPFETVSVVKVSMNEVIKTFLEALLLVILVVYIFLQNWRATLIPVLAIPVSIIGTLIVFIPLGFSINTLTMFAFVLSIGIVVDDAIVVVEAVQHYIDHLKLTPKEATRRAMKDISAPVIAIALILAAVFVPVSFVPGIVGRLYQQFALTIAVSVLISAFVALSLTPALCVLLLKPSSTKLEPSWIDKAFGKFNVFFAKVTRSYRRGVGAGMRKTPLVLVMLVCIFVGLYFLFQNKPTGFIPTEDEGRVLVAYEMPEGTSTTRNAEFLKELMRALQTIPEIKNIGGISAYNALSQSSKSNTGTVFVSLTNWDERKRPDQSVRAVMGKIAKATQHMKEATVRTIAPPAIPGLGNASGFSVELLQTTSTANLKEFENIANQFIGKLFQQPEIAAAYTFFNTRTPGYEIEVDRVVAKRMGVSLIDVYSTLSALLGSRYINDFNVYGRNFRVVAQADSSYRTSVENLGQYFVRNQQGAMIPLANLITYKMVENPSVINHFNMYRAINIQGMAKPGYSSGQALQAITRVAAELPQGFGYEFSGLSREEAKAGNTQMMIFAISILFVFLFLAALYESWSIPFSVLLAVPIGAFGSIAVLSLFPWLTNNVYAQIGLITLIGLAAKNAILIVEYAKERIDKGVDITHATIVAIHLRLRPIVMTSLAFILGVVPLALATGAGAISRQTIGWTVIGGMLAASTIAIFVVPILFVAIAKIAYRKKKKEI